MPWIPRSACLFCLAPLALASDRNVTTAFDRQAGWNESTDHLRIMILMDPSPITYLSGQSMRFRILLRHLVDVHPNDQIHLVTAEQVHPNPPTSCLDEKIPIHYTWGFRLPQYRSLTVSLDLTAKVWRLCRKYKFDIIHVTSPGLYLFPAILVSRFYGIPLLMSYHTHIPVYVRTYLPVPWNTVAEWILWRLLKWIHSFADLTVVTSPQIATDLKDHGIHHTQLWPKGVNTTHFHPQFHTVEMREKMSSGNPDDFLLVFVGRLAREKRLNDLKDILNGLLSKGIPARLCIIGDGPQWSELQEYFKGTPTTFLGSLQGEALAEAFSSGDVFVMPSDSETLGFVVMESLASGVPVVASEAGGLIDLIQDGETGFLVPTGDSDAFVEKIELLHHNLDLKKRMGERGRLFAKEWSWEASMNYLRQIAYPHAIHNSARRYGRTQPTATEVVP